MNTEQADTRGTTARIVALGEQLSQLGGQLALQRQHIAELEAANIDAVSDYNRCVDDVHAARDRIAELEAERDEWREAYENQRQIIEDEMRPRIEALRAQRDADREREYGYSQETVNALTAERDALKTDAERYRWLREEALYFGFDDGKESPWAVLGTSGYNCNPVSGEALDAAIDAAKVGSCT